MKTVMNDKENLEFMNHPERVNAEKELREALERVRGMQTLSAQTILTCMPPALKKLEKAYDNLSIIEAKIELEIRDRRN